MSYVKSDIIYLLKVKYDFKKFIIVLKKLKANLKNNM